MGEREESLERGGRHRSEEGDAGVREMLEGGRRCIRDFGREVVRGRRWGRC